MTIIIQLEIGMNHHLTFARPVKTILVLILDTKWQRFLWMAHLIWPGPLNHTSFEIRSSQSKSELIHPNPWGIFFTQFPSHLFVAGEATQQWYSLHLSFRSRFMPPNSIEFYLNSFNFSPRFD